MAHGKLSIADQFPQESPLATEFRRLFHHIVRNQDKSDLKSILVTSAVTAEGKSTISSCLSITSARKGYKTLLIDCDLRRPSLHRLFGFERQSGIMEVLSEGVPVKSVIRKTDIDNLDIITAGTATAHPSELFDSRAIGSLVSDLKFYYDYAFVDAPPVIPVSDPMLLAQELDGVILVVKAGSTAREVVERAADIMRSNGANVIGVVLNNAKGSLPYYYDYSHYHYDYSPRLPEKGRARRRPGSSPLVQHPKPERSDRSQDHRGDIPDPKRSPR
jgi:capsular exopolysaccharide synthesis family protein